MGGDDHHNHPSAGKVFIGGLASETVESDLKDYFGAYGELTDVVVMKDKMSGKGRGFGFVTFADPKVADRVVAARHEIRGKSVEAKSAVPRNDGDGRGGSVQAVDKICKIFVGGIAPHVSNDEFRAYFEKFGKVTDAAIMMDKHTDRSRGFGFVTMDSPSVADDVCRVRDHSISGKQVEVKKAFPRDDKGRAAPHLARDRGRGGGGGGGGGDMGPEQMMQMYQMMMMMQQSAMGMGMGMGGGGGGRGGGGGGYDRGMDRYGGGGGGDYGGYGGGYGGGRDMQGGDPSAGMGQAGWGQGGQDWGGDYARQAQAAGYAQQGGGYGGAQAADASQYGGQDMDAMYAMYQMMGGGGAQGGGYGQQGGGGYGGGSGGAGRPDRGGGMGGRERYHPYGR